MHCALYFGSFNPLHIGHVSIARHVLQMGEIDCFRFVLSPHNPIKSQDTLMDAQTRLEALKEAISQLNDNRFEVSDVEFHLSKPLYTYNTLVYIARQEPQNKFSIIIGADNLAIIEKWHNWQAILSEFDVWVYPRKGYDAQALCKKYHTTYIDAPQIDISSTEIRTKGLDKYKF